VETVPAEKFARFFLQDFAERVLLAAIYMSRLYRLKMLLIKIWIIRVKLEFYRSEDN
jgi:hypothetical protein